jgi:hypothetical protein
MCVPSGEEDILVLDELLADINKKFVFIYLFIYLFVSTAAKMPCLHNYNEATLK